MSHRAGAGLEVNNEHQNYFQYSFLGQVLINQQVPKEFSDEIQVNLGCLKLHFHCEFKNICTLY